MGIVDCRIGWGRRRKTPSPTPSSPPVLNIKPRVNLGIVSAQTQVTVNLAYGYVYGAVSPGATRRWAADRTCPLGLRHRARPGGQASRPHAVSLPGSPKNAL